MAMPARLVVAAACPACAAALDFVEGATCARCGHCGTRIVLPGRRHVFTYWVPPRVNASRARAVARGARPGARDPQLCFLPYYRFTAQELRWEWPAPPGSTATERDPAVMPVFAERAIERNFIGCRWDGFGLYSIGVRTSALRLSLFRSDALPSDARVVAPETGCDAALAHALCASDDVVAQRAILCGMLGVVYFPSFAVPLGPSEDDPIAVVDGVSGTLVTEDGPHALRTASLDPGRASASSIDGRPLACPNCGWELPDDPDHVVFFCTQCARAWELDGSRLAPLACDVVPTPAPLRRRVRHLPMWIVEVTRGLGDLRRIVVPGFRQPSLRMPLVLAARLTRLAHDLPPADGDPPADAVGASFDRTDAVALARFVAAGIDRDAAAAAELGDARLVWWPFERLPGSLREPGSRFALQTVTPAPASARLES
jgi:DNA-directed RNA polymerase subunit RPC12/RpoP